MNMMMMTPYRFRLRLRSPWRTPWQADTLFGALCWIGARHDGSDVLRREVIEPSLRGDPPMVLSDGFFGDRLPFPEAWRFHEWSAADWPTIKTAEWLHQPDFERIRNGHAPTAEQCFSDSSISQIRLQHTRRRDTDTTPDEGGLHEHEDWHAPTDPTADGTLSVYVRVKPAFAQRLLDWFESLADIGFGADHATGRGQFEIDSIERAEWLDATPTNANAIAALSTFQPNTSDPTIGVWKAFSKFGRIGHGHGLTNDETQKRPLIVFRPGACFLTKNPSASPDSSASRPFIGRAIPMRELLIT